MRYFDNAMMWINDKYCHSPKSAVPQNIKLLVKALMDLVLSYRIIRNIKIHKNEYVISKLDIFRAVSDSYINVLILFITWRLSCFCSSQTIGTPDSYGERTSHDPTFHFLGSSKYGQTYTSPQLTRIMDPRKIQRSKR